MPQVPYKKRQLSRLACLRCHLRFALVPACSRTAALGAVFRRPESPGLGAGRQVGCSVQRGLPDAAAGTPAAGEPQSAKNLPGNSDTEGRFRTLQLSCGDQAPVCQCHHIQELDRFPQKARMAPGAVAGSVLGARGGSSFAPVLACIRPAPAHMTKSGADRGRTAMTRRHSATAATAGLTTAGTVAGGQASAPLLHTAWHSGAAQTGPGKSGTGLVPGVDWGRAAPSPGC